MHQRIVNRPESVEQKCIFIPAGNWFHFVVRLVSNAMINEFDFCLRTKIRVQNYRGNNRKAAKYAVNAGGTYRAVETGSTR